MGGQQIAENGVPILPVSMQRHGSGKNARTPRHCGQVRPSLDTTRHYRRRAHDASGES
jgi:hypothetical protein